MKPFPRLVLIVSIVGALGFAVNQASTRGLFASNTNQASESTPVTPVNSDTTAASAQPTQVTQPIKAEEPELRVVNTPAPTETSDAGLAGLLNAGVKK